MPLSAQIYASAPQTFMPHVKWTDFHCSNSLKDYLSWIITGLSTLKFALETMANAPLSRPKGGCWAVVSRTIEPRI